MPVRLVRRASDDLDDIYQYGVGQWGDDQADRYAKAFWHAVARIEAAPLSYRLREEVRPPVRVYPAGAHLIIYDVEREADQDVVVIVRVAHARSDWANDLS